MCLALVQIPRELLLATGLYYVSSFEQFARLAPC